MASHIDLWITQIERHSTALRDCYLGILSDTERQRYHQLLLASDKERYLTAHLLLRIMLSHKTVGEVDPRCWRFTQDIYGKPVIDTRAGLPHLNFNLSHSKGLAVVAVSPTCQVGVDIEPLYEPSGADLTGTVLSPGEHAWLKGRPRSVRWVDFTRLWTIKEAYSKLIGLGFWLDFTSFEVALDPVRMVQSEWGGPQPDDLYLETREIQMPDGLYYLSLAGRCSRVEPLKVNLRILDSSFIDCTMAVQRALYRNMISIHKCNDKRGCWG